MKSSSYLWNKRLSFHHYAHLNRLSIYQSNKMLSVFKDKLIIHLLHCQHTFEEQELIYMGKERASDNIVDRPFWSTFGVSSIVCNIVWQLLQNSPTDIKNMTPDHLLWGVLWKCIHLRLLILEWQEWIRTLSANGLTLQL